MTRPLTGQREVFRRLQEREEGRIRRQYEQEELMGVEHNENIGDYRQYWDTVDTIQQELLTRRGLHSTYYAPPPPRRDSSIRGSSIRGRRSEYSLFDEWYMAYDPYRNFYEAAREEPLVKRDIELTVHGDNGRDYTVRIRKPFSFEDPHTILKTRTSPHNRWTWEYGHINDFFVSRDDVYFDTFSRRIRRKAIVYKVGDKETVVFGTKESFVRQLMENNLLEFFGYTKQEIEARRLIEAQAPMKSFTRLLLRKE